MATLLHVFEHGLVPDDLQAPPAAVEYARRLAQRDVPIVALSGDYCVGHGLFLSWCIDEPAGRSPDADLAAAVTSRMIDRSFRYIDRVSEQLITAYQLERTAGR